MQNFIYKAKKNLFKNYNGIYKNAFKINHLKLETLPVMSQYKCKVSR